MILLKRTWNIKNKHFKMFEKEYENQYNGYRLENEDEKQKHISEKLSNLRLHKITKRIEIDSFIMGFRCC